MAEFPKDPISNEPVNNQAQRPSHYNPYGDVQPITIQIPEQKSSRAPWIILGIIVLLIVLAMASCVAAPFMFMSSFSESMGNFSSSSTSRVTTMAQANSIAVFDFTQPISGTSGSTPLQMYETLSAIEKDSNIKAVVVRVNNPGGTVAASEEIGEYVKNFSKPIVFSVSDMCASGAYWTASQGDFIMAMSTSEVGSIGVIMQYANIQGLLEKLGIEMGSIKSADAKDAGAMYRSLTEEEKAEFQAKILEINDKFIAKVAEGRGLDESKVREYATGETFAGDEALEMGLIDGIGTYADALDKAAELAGMEPGSYKVYTMNLYYNVFNLSSFLSESKASDFEMLQYLLAKDLEDKGFVAQYQ